MHSFELIEHTADVRLYIKAESLPELFKVALEGMNELIAPGQPTSISPALKEELCIDSPDITALLIDFMNEVLAFTHIHNALFSCVTFDNFSPTKLSGYVEGCSIDQFEEDIKAVTYHEAQIVHNDAGFYETMIVFDI